MDGAASTSLGGHKAGNHAESQDSAPDTAPRSQPGTQPSARRINPTRRSHHQLRDSARPKSLYSTVDRLSSSDLPEWRTSRVPREKNPFPIRSVCRALIGIVLPEQMIVAPRGATTRRRVSEIVTGARTGYLVQLILTRAGRSTDQRLAHPTPKNRNRPHRGEPVCSRIKISPIERVSLGLKLLSGIRT
jgi:hypothetical protein